MVGVFKFKKAKKLGKEVYSFEDHSTSKSTQWSVFNIFCSKMTNLATVHRDHSQYVVLPSQTRNLNQLDPDLHRQPSEGFDDDFGD